MLFNKLAASKIHSLAPNYDFQKMSDWETFSLCPPKNNRILKATIKTENMDWKKLILRSCLFQEVLIDSAEPGGDEDLGGRALHRGRGLPGVPGPGLR